MAGAASSATVGGQAVGRASQLGGRGLYRVTEAEPTVRYTGRYTPAAVCARVPDAIICLLSASVHGLGTRVWMTK